MRKAEYCPRVAAASRTLKTPQNPCDLEFWPMILKFNRVCAVVKKHVHAKCRRAKCSGS